MKNRRPEGATALSDAGGVGIHVNRHGQWVGVWSALGQISVGQETSTR